MRMSRRMGLYGSKKLFTWAKYNTVKTFQEQSANIDLPYDNKFYISCSAKPTINNETGKYVPAGMALENQQLNQSNASFLLSGTYIIESYGSDTCYHITGQNVTASSCGATKYTIQVKSASQGSTSYGTVQSADPNAYPTNGVHTDGYWYVLQ